MFFKNRLKGKNLDIHGVLSDLEKKYPDLKHSFEEYIMEYKKVDNLRKIFSEESQIRDQFLYGSIRSKTQSFQLL